MYNFESCSIHLNYTMSICIIEHSYKNILMVDNYSLKWI